MSSSVYHPVTRLGSPPRPLKLRISVLTHNIDSIPPSHFAATPLLQDFLGRGKRADIIVVGLQEVVDLSDKELAAKIILLSTREHEVTPLYTQWLSLISTSLEQVWGSSYVLVGSRSLVGLFSCVFARRSIAERIEEVRTEVVKSGFEHSYGNKGATIISFKFKGVNCTFVNAHLTSGKKPSKQSERTQDLRQILAHLPPDGIILFSGDLNMRAQNRRSIVMDSISRGIISELLCHDELILSKAEESHPLYGFEEGEIGFNPTWKFDHDSEMYDTSKKARTPSWCDRILVKSDSEISLEEYTSLSCPLSDHRAVMGRFKSHISIPST